ncbi:unnamed protein product [Schistosoma mattheei]|uniref:Uncharacterized protein n=1 Tax=Schistosoma mattheei TaxID=31246 RepID=A0A183Q1M6_9TREM|nr:unnamed protein product [Schistosoma mattheei]
MQLDDLDFADDLVLLSQSQQQMQEKTTSIAAGASTGVCLNIRKPERQILPYNTACTNPIKIDGEDLEDVKTFTYLDSITDEQGGSDADVKARIAVNQHQGQDFQYKSQDSSTVWSGNLENYESHHPEDTGVH